MKGFVVGIDLGGTNLRGAAIDLEGSFLARSFTSSLTPLSKGEGVKKLRKEIEGLLEQGLSRGYRPLGIGLGVAGVLSKDGVLTQSPNLQNLAGVPLSEELGSSLSLPLKMDNDANMYTMGEGWRGAARGVKDFCCLTLGTGVGGGIVMGGELYRGAYGTAGEIGHMVIDEDGLPCYCGNRGCLETYASGTGIVRRAMEVGQKVRSSYELYEAANRGDQMAQEIFWEMGRYLGVGMANLVNMLNPAMIVLGGKVSGAWNYFIPSALEEMKRRAFRYPVERVKVVKGMLGDDAALWGCTYLVFQELGIDLG
ncbi:MAG: ROK family protein [Deltaproteobacteria bacterium]|nr:ROK family protein [Deltaproteobacteria bacterium]